MIYLINAEGTDLYKIGFTNQNSNNRMKVLQTGCPYKLKLIDVFNGGLAIEKEINVHFKEIISYVFEILIQYLTCMFYPSKAYNVSFNNIHSYCAIITTDVLLLVL